jgi:lysophospholipase L1-like esterase
MCGQCVSLKTFYLFDYVLGTNNLMFYNEEDTAHRIKEVINHILAKMPNTKILLLGIIPRLGDLEKKVQTTNAIISKFNDDKHVFYLDMSNAFQDSPGKEKTGLYADTVHPSVMGYLVWYQNMESLLQKLLK